MLPSVFSFQGLEVCDLPDNLNPTEERETKNLGGGVFVSQVLFHIVY